MLFLKQQLILPFLCHKSATTCQIDLNKVSHSKLKLDLCNCVKIDTLNLQLLHIATQTGHNILGHPIL